MTDREPPLLPLPKTKLGRPKKLRKRSAGELTKDKKKGKEQVQLSKDGVHVSRQYVRLHCTICKQAGHNSRTCSLNTTVREKTQKRKRQIQPTIQESTAAGDATEIPIHGETGVEHNEIANLDDPLSDTWDAIEIPFDLLDEQCHVFDITQTAPDDDDNTQPLVDPDNTHREVVVDDAAVDATWMHAALDATNTQTEVTVDATNTQQKWLYCHSYTTNRSTSY